jgi:hypothetical protein
MRCADDANQELASELKEKKEERMRLGARHAVLGKLIEELSLERSGAR